MSVDYKAMSRDKAIDSEACLRVWPERTGKSARAFYRRLAEMR